VLDGNCRCKQVFFPGGLGDYYKVGVSNAMIKHMKEDHKKDWPPAEEARPRPSECTHSNKQVHEEYFFAPTGSGSIRYTQYCPDCGERRVLAGWPLLL